MPFQSEVKLGSISIYADENSPSEFQRVADDCIQLNQRINNVCRRSVFNSYQNNME